MKCGTTELTMDVLTQTLGDIASIAAKAGHTAAAAAAYIVANTPTARLMSLLRRRMRTVSKRTEV